MSMTLTKTSVADLGDLLGHLHVALSQLGDVDEALDAVLDADEGAEGNQLGDLAGDDLADGVACGRMPATDPPGSP